MADPGHRRSSQARQTFGTPQVPARGDLGVAQRSGFQQLRDWRKDTAVKPALAAFPVGAALRLVDQHKLLNDWTTTKRIEFRHRDFVQEIGKELLLP